MSWLSMAVVERALRVGAVARVEVDVAGAMHHQTPTAVGVGGRRGIVARAAANSEQREDPQSADYRQIIEHLQGFLERRVAFIALVLVS